MKPTELPKTNSGSCSLDRLVGRFVVAQPQLVPEKVAVCPECGCRLYWQVMTEDGLEDLSLDCENEPDVYDNDEAWEEDCHRNYQSDWQPIIDRVKAWIISANVRDHLQPAEARLLPGEERTQAEDVTRVDVR